jgi:predicted kinase
MEVNMSKPKCYQLIGVPGSGKSTWVSSQKWGLICAYVSTDRYVEAYAESVGLTYSEVFHDVMPGAVAAMVDSVELASSMKQDVIWDQTSVSVKSRKRKFQLLPNYEHIAVVFKTPDQTELLKRLATRPGKNIPWHVMEDMIKNLEMPTEEEGFSEIWYAE